MGEKINDKKRLQVWKILCLEIFWKWKSDGVECLQKLLKNLLWWESGYFLETHDT